MPISEIPNAQRITYLVSAYIAGTIDYPELQELENWRKEKKDHEKLFQEVISKEHQEHAIVRMQSYNTNKSLEKLLANMQDKGNARTISIFWKRLTGAAAALLFISLVSYYTYRVLPSKTLANEVVLKAEDIEPGVNRAILTLSDGNKVNLNAINSVSQINESGISIKRESEGKLVYVLTDIAASKDKYNTIETPNGGQYHLVLSDGSQVWLNAASSITYPVNLKGKGQRIVTIKGEAYFQVAKDKKHPFLVKSNGQEITVLGTHFNVNGYADEGQTVTTLEEGSVMVNANNQSIIIKPGQQTVQTKSLLSSQQADMEQALAWKNGDFDFKDADVQTIMRQISRWYDIEVVYPDGIPKDLITGGISRNSNLATVLKMLELVRIKYKLENRSGRKILLIMD